MVDVPLVRFLAEEDMSIPGAIECRAVTVGELELWGLKGTEALLRVFRLVRSL